MSVKKACGALLLGLALMAMMPAPTEAGHRHHRGCGHRSARVYSYDHYRPHYSYDYDRGYYAGRYYDDVDYDAPYVARHGSGRSRYYDDDDYDYGYRGYSRSRSYSAPRYSSRRVGYHYHGRTRCFRPDRSHLYFTLRLF
jgi:hypothetical protein